MSLELEFWESDGNGEALQFAIRVSAWQIHPFVTRYTRPETVYVTLRNTARREEWVIWVRRGYRSATGIDSIGPLETR